MWWSKEWYYTKVSCFKERKRYSGCKSWEKRNTDRRIDYQREWNKKKVRKNDDGYKRSYQSIANGSGDSLRVAANSKRWVERREEAIW